MNGAQSLIRTLYDGGVDTCFMNPGTSEMHFVAALDFVPQMHSILCLFEGVATGCAGRLRPHDRQAGSDASAHRARFGQWNFQFAQWAQGPLPNCQYCWGSRHLSPQIRCPTDVRYRGFGPAGFRVGSALRQMHARSPATVPQP